MRAQRWDSQEGVGTAVTAGSAQSSQLSGRPRTRLLFLSAKPPPLGGIPTWLLGVLDSQLGERFEMRVVNTSPPEKRYVESGSRFRLDRAWVAVPALFKLLWQLIWFRPHLLHVNTPYFWALVRDGAAVWLASWFGVKTLLHFHGGDLEESVEASSPLARRMIEATLRRTDCLIAITRQTETYLHGKVEPERVDYLANFLDLHGFEAILERGEARREGPLRVLFVGWMLEAKGVPELLEAASHFPDVQFTLIGHYHTEFVDRIEEQLEAARDHVTVLEPVPRNQMVGLYREADVFVLPTRREGFPMVILEAMAAGLPVISTPIGAIPDMVRDGEEGLIVPERDSAALTAALTQLLGDPALRTRMGERGRQRVSEVYSREVVVSQLEALYRRLLGD